MKKHKNDWVWNEIMCKHLPENYELECKELYQDCYDYSPIEYYTDVMVFVTKAFIERNRQLEQKRTIVQVKMKWGYLTIYYDGERDPYLDEVINTVSRMAETIKDKLDEMYGTGGFRRRKILHPSQNK